MNKKLLVIALLIVVIGIWSKVGYDFYYYSNLEKNSVHSGSVVNHIQKLDADTLEYTLKLDYDDPFLGKRGVVKPNRSASSSPRPLVSRPKPIDNTPKPILVKWPKVNYVGHVQGLTRNKETVTLKVNGEESVLSQGESIFGVKLAVIYPDSLLLSFQNQTKTILR